MDFCIARKDSEIAQRILEVWDKPTPWQNPQDGSQMGYVFRGLPFEYDNKVECVEWTELVSVGDEEEVLMPITEGALLQKIIETIQADHEKVVLIGKGPLGPLHEWMGKNGLLPVQEEI